MVRDFIKRVLRGQWRRRHDDKTCITRGEIKPEPRPRSCSLSRRLFIVNEMKKREKRNEIPVRRTPSNKVENKCSYYIPILALPSPLLPPISRPVSHLPLRLYRRKSLSARWNERKRETGCRNVFFFFARRFFSFSFFSYIATEADIGCVSIIRLRVGNKHGGW